MPSKKTDPTESAAATTPADPAGDAPLPMPATGGCWVRLPDGNLARDPAEHPDTPADAPQA